MNFEKFTGSLEQTERYGIRYNTSMPVTRRWYRYNKRFDSMDFLNEGDYIVSFDYDSEKLFFVSDAGFQAYRTSTA